MLSNQQVVDCGGNGCNGGNALGAFTYIKNAGGIIQESDYPFFSGNTNKLIIRLFS